MKRKLVILLAIPSIALAAGLSFWINNDYSTWNITENISAVNLEPGPRIYVVQHPNEGPETSARMDFKNGWSQMWAIMFPHSTSPWGPIAGTELNVKAACRKLPDSMIIQCMQQYAGSTSPIILDLGKDGIKLGQRGSAVAFDIDGDGKREWIQWTRYGGDEAFLTRDVNGNGIVDNGSELFGNAMRLSNGHYAANGYQALADLDSSGTSEGDGQISSHDERWPELSLWRDANADGICTKDEVTSLGAVGVVMLSTNPSTESGIYDDAGNWFPLWGWARSIQKPHRIQTTDVWFARLD